MINFKNSQEIRNFYRENFEKELDVHGKLKTHYTEWLEGLIIQRTDAVQ